MRYPKQYYYRITMRSGRIGYISTREGEYDPRELRESKLHFGYDVTRINVKTYIFNIKRYQ